MKPNDSLHCREMVSCAMLKHSMSFEELLLHMCESCRERILSKIIRSITEELPDEGFIEVELTIRHYDPFKKTPRVIARFASPDDYPKKPIYEGQPGFEEAPYEEVMLCGVRPIKMVADK